MDKILRDKLTRVQIKEFERTILKQLIAYGDLIRAHNYIEAEKRVHPFQTDHGLEEALEISRAEQMNMRHKIRETAAEITRMKIELEDPF